MKVKDFEILLIEIISRFILTCSGAGIQCASKIEKNIYKGR